MQWLDAVRRVRAIAQTGLAYGKDHFDVERYRELLTISESMIAALIDESPQKVSESFSVERGYPTPKVDVRIAAFLGEQLLLVREREDGAWSLPGGWADEDDSPREAVVREAREESGYEVKAERVWAIKDRSRHPYRPRRLDGVYKICFVGSIVGGAPRPSEETLEVGLFDPQSLPQLSLDRVLPTDIAEAVAARRDPSFVTRFD